jgi:hypothetical protein
MFVARLLCRNILGVAAGVSAANLWGARASGVGDRALAIMNFYFCR